MEAEKPRGSLAFKILSVLFCLGALFGLGAFLLSGDNLTLIRTLFVKDVAREDIQDVLSRLGWRGYITVGALSFLQVMFAFLPAEPAEVIAGISFGFWRGGLACLVGVFLGNSLLFLLYKLFGTRLTKYFAANVEFDFDVARRSPHVSLIIILLYVLPAIPYGFICLFAASLGIRFPKYTLLTVLGTIPSLALGVGMGHLAVESSLFIAIAVFLLIVTALIVLVRYRSALFRRINAFMAARNEKARLPRAPSRFFLFVADYISRIIYWRKVKVVFKNNVGRLEHPSIVLCNHGSFIDFVYAGRMLRRERPHFLCARLYFYHKRLGALLRFLGCIPKSMFSADLENAKACLRTLNAGRVIALMPEARLSTVGRFEGIQDATYDFIRRMGVTVYVCRLSGDYFADPKWGSGVRRGAVVEVELSRLFEAGETKDLTPEAVRARVDTALRYDEYEWLATCPHIRYRSPSIAEGLENVLYLCPQCGMTTSLRATGDTLRCTACGLTARLDERYAFRDGAPFKNPAEWYGHQTEVTRRDILADPEFALVSRVTLRHGSQDGKHTTRRAGAGVCTLDRSGLTYRGTRDGAEIEKHFPIASIYRLLFGAGENFEIYEGKEIWYFQPDEPRSAVMWYVVSGLLKNL